MVNIPLSTTIAPAVKRAALAYCKKHGVKLSYLIEQALIEQLEDDIDRDAYAARLREPTLSLADALAQRTKPRAPKVAAKVARRRV
jgi:hypothetical protein